MNTITSPVYSDAPNRPWYRSVSPRTWIVLLNCLVYAAMGLPLRVSNSQAMAWGASWGPLTLDGQWWRLFTSLFVHNGLAHLSSNMFIVWLVGRGVEKVFSGWTFIGLYVLAGVAGEICSLARHPETLSHGASGAVLGVTAAMLAALLFRQADFIANRRGQGVILVTCLLAVGMYDNGVSGQINTIAHVGGLTTGFVLGALLCRVHEGFPQHKQRILLTASLVLTSAVIAVRIKNSWVLPVGVAMRELEADHLANAEAQLNVVVLQHPNDVYSNLVLADLYRRQNRLAEAEAALKLVLMVEPTNNTAEYNLGVVYLQDGRFDDAQKCVSRLIRNGHMGSDVQELFADALAGQGKYALAGDQYLTLKQYDDAIYNLRKALYEHPLDKNVLHDLAEAYRAKGMTTDAEAIEKQLPPSSGTNSPGEQGR